MLVSPSVAVDVLSHPSRFMSMVISSPIMIVCSRDYWERKPQGLPETLPVGNVLNAFLLEIE